MISPSNPDEGAPPHYWRVYIGDPVAGASAFYNTCAYLVTDAIAQAFIHYQKLYMPDPSCIEGGLIVEARAITPYDQAVMEVNDEYPQHIQELDEIITESHLPSSA